VILVTAQKSLFAAVRREIAESYDDGLLVGIVRTIRWLYPPWWFWRGFVTRWMRHDCDKQPITCRAEILFRTPGWMWLDV
jgi:hypothetical protein